MNRTGIWKLVRPFHGFSVRYEKNKSVNILKDKSLPKERGLGPAPGTGPQQQYNLKKALQFIASTSLTNRGKSAIEADPKGEVSNNENKPTWLVQKTALQRKFQGAQWNPPKRLSRQEMESVRLLKSQFPKMTATDLATKFKISPEAIRRILKAKWTPNEDDANNIQLRWSRRGQRIKEMYRDKIISGQPQPDDEVVLPVLTLKYNPDGSIHDYYKKRPPLVNTAKPSKKRNRKNKNFHLLHKHKD